MSEAAWSQFAVLEDGLLTDKRAHELSAWYAARGYIKDPLAMEVNWLAIRVGNAVLEAGRPRDPIMSFARFSILRDLYRAEGNRLSMTELGHRLSVALAYISKLVDSLVGAGLVERIEDTVDKRKTWAQLTPAGDEYVRELLPRVASQVERNWSCLSPSGKKLLVHLLAKARLDLQIQHTFDRFTGPESIA